MNALIFAAGLGTRLKPLTDTMPKALVPIHGKPLVQILLEKLKGCGVAEVVINVHHYAQQIVDFVSENDGFGLKVKFSDETDTLLDTGGGLKKAASLFSNNAPILVHNVDILSNADLAAFYADADTTTLLVSQRETQRYLLFDAKDKLVAWANVATGQIKSPHAHLMDYNGRALECIERYGLKKYAFAGIQVFHPTLLPLMDAWPGRFSIIDFYLDVCSTTDIKCRFDADLRLLDVGKLDAIAQAEAFLPHVLC